jgi:3-dehydroquinate synthase
MSHGEAISVGMAAAARLAHRLGKLSSSDVARIEGVLSRWGLPIRQKRRIRRAELLAAMARDKKNQAGRFRFIIPTAIGRCRAVDNVPSKILNQVLSEVGL